MNNSLKYKGRSRRGFLLRPFSTAAAAAAADGRTSQNFAAIGALLYDPAFQAVIQEPRNKEWLFTIEGQNLYD